MVFCFPLSTLVIPTSQKKRKEKMEVLKQIEQHICSKGN
jgi:hypothetical protein